MPRSEKPTETVDEQKDAVNTDGAQSEVRSGRGDTTEGNGGADGAIQPLSVPGMTPGVSAQERQSCAHEVVPSKEMDDSRRREANNVDTRDHIQSEAMEHAIKPTAKTQVNERLPGCNSGAETEDQQSVTERPKHRSTDEIDEEYDEKHTPPEDAQADLPDAPQGPPEATGSEIQNIIDQFQDGMGGLGEQEIMSPRLERQQPILVLPPRTSSLEHKDGQALSPQTTGQSISSQRSTGGAGSVIGPNTHHVQSADDNESIRSSKAGSIFQPPPPEPEPALPFDFHRFLEQLRHRTADPVARFLRSFLAEFGKKQWMVHEQVKIISDFLEFISHKMAQCEVWRSVSEAEFDNAKEGMEKLVMNRLYTQTFSPAIPPAPGSPKKGGRNGRSQADAANPYGPGRRGQHQEDVERDEVIAQKMRIYGWVSEEHLDIKPIGEKGRKFMGLAQQELLKINSYRAPRDKVICVLNCCKVIFGFLKNAKADQSADAFVPLLIYAVLRARPENLVSNVQYIWRFRNQDKLGGEAGYYMSSLMGVVTFIENLDRTNLTISDEEFERQVEQAVSAIAEKNKEQESEERLNAMPSGRRMQYLSEKSALSRPEVTPRNSSDAERASPTRRALDQRIANEKTPQSLSTDDDDTDAVSGLLKTIQKPLSNIGRLFSDETSSQATQRKPSPQPPTSRPSVDGRGSRQPSQQRQAGDAAAIQASAETAEAQRVRMREHKVVVETLQSMFPNLDKEVIEDVTRAQEGNVGRAVDACLALSG